MLCKSTVPSILVLFALVWIICVSVTIPGLIRSDRDLVAIGVSKQLHDRADSCRSGTIFHSAIETPSSPMWHSSSQLPDPTMMLSIPDSDPCHCAFHAICCHGSNCFPRRMKAIHHLHSELTHRAGRPKMSGSHLPWFRLSMLMPLSAQCANYLPL